MSKTSLYIAACAFLGLVGATSCQDNLERATSTTDTRAVVLDRDLFAVKGCIYLKLTPDAQHVMPTSTSGKVELQSAPSQMASALQFASAYKMERVFQPAGIYEARTVAAGLDRWYTLYFDKTKDVAEVLAQFSHVKGVEYAERVLPMVRPTTQAVPYVAEPASGNAKTAPGIFNDSLLSKQWHYINDGTVDGRAIKGADCNLKPVWEKYTTGKKSVIVAIVDGGIDVTHEDLVDNLYINEKEKNGQPNVDDDGNGFVDDVYGYNFVEGKDIVGGKIEPDAEGHGTHVAGTVGARNNNGKGVAGVAGGDGTPGSGVRLMSCQIFRNKNEEGNAPAAIKYAADNGAIICQNSWGYSSSSGITEMPRVLKESIDYFIKMAGCDAEGKQRADSPMKGGVVVFAAGNENKEFSAYPACYAPTISVSAFGWDFTKASYSNYGKWMTIAAPGGDQERFGTTGGVLSTVPKSKVAAGYAYMQGTSMACPHVSGIAALVASYYGRQGFTADELKARLVSAYRPYNIDELNVTYAGKLGRGYIDAEAAFETDTHIAPEKVERLTLKPDFVDVTAEWSVAKDEEKTAAFYRVYLSESELTAANLANHSYIEINGVGHQLGETLKHNFDGLLDNSTYYVAVVAVDRWGHLSAPNIQRCTTKRNHAPEVTNFPESAMEVSEDDHKSFSFQVADPDGHNWDVKAVGETQGVSYTVKDNTVTVRLVPVLKAGQYTCTFVVSDDLGAKLEKQLTFKILEYVPPRLAQSFDNLIIGLDEGAVKLPLQPHYVYNGRKALTYDAQVTNSNIATATVEGDQLLLKPLVKGITRISLSATDGRQSAADASFQIRVVEKKAAPVYAVYPIPVKRDLNALLNPEVKQAELEVYTTVGQRVMTTTVAPDKNHVATVSLAHLSAGTYKLVVHTSKGKHTQLFIKR